VDGVLHLAGDAVALADLLVDGGRLASTLGAGADAFEGRDITATAVLASPAREALESLAGLLARESVRAAITRTYALDDAPRAFAEFSGTLGKAVVTAR
jgi:NADPH:quinone reductase-like Zn-dependent oxidoreductase